ncbi:hypothetical protein cypCar_00042388 [Cyprinus carpio]|nr:hypothetical protein cypCar_00042388 [Cyprinus carpio]
MKFKPNQTRTYDREGFKRRAACLCFKNEREDEVTRSSWLAMQHIVKNNLGLAQNMPGRKREWFPVDEAIKVLQGHKPVHAEYLRRLRISRPSTTTNGNLLLPQTSPSTLTPLFSAPASAARR